MKKIILICLFFSHLSSNAQSTLTFNYDEAGNQTLRLLVLGDSDNFGKSETFSSFFEGDELKYWPNPVDGLLHLTWQNNEIKHCTKLMLTNNKGQSLLNKALSEDQAIIQIDFSQYSTGIYFITLQYSNQEQKQIKIIKK